VTPSGIGSFPDVFNTGTTDAGEFGTARSGKVAESVISGKTVMLQFKVSEGGRVVIPAELRAKHGIQVGDTVTWRDSADGLMLSSRQAAIRRIQAVAAKFKKPGVSVVDEFIREKREEAARE